MTKLILNKRFGENLQRIRASRGLTQEETISKIQILGSPLSRSTYSLIELGRNNIYITDLVCLQHVFQVNYSEFFQDIPTAR